MSQFLKKNIYLLVFLGMCVCLAYVCPPRVQDPLEVRRGHLIPLELEFQQLQAALEVLGTDRRSPAGAVGMHMNQ